MNLPALNSVFVVIALAAMPTGHAAEAKCDRQPVMQIDSAMVSVEAESVTISAFGTVESAGWSGPELRIATQSGDTATVDISACRPEMSAQVLSPIQVKEKLALGSGVRNIVIQAKTNSMTVEITRN